MLLYLKQINYNLDFFKQLIMSHFIKLLDIKQNISFNKKLI